MDIIFYHPFYDTAPWLAGIGSRLPQANIRVWQPGDNQHADYAIVWRPPYEMLAGRQGLKAILALGAGVDAIVEQERANSGFIPAGIPLIRLQDAGMALQMEEYVLAAVLRYFRRMDEYQHLQQQGRWQLLEPHAYADFTIGVMGLGILGRHVATQLARFGFNVRGWSRNKKHIDGVISYGGGQLAEFLSGTRLIVNLLPKTPETQGILNASLFEQLATGSYIINIARGGHLVEQDLLTALDSGQLRAATLDVFTQEPLAENHPFWQRPEITLTPHISAMTLPDNAMDQICDNIAAFDSGQPVSGIVDLAQGY